MHGPLEVEGVSSVSFTHNPPLLLLFLLKECRNFITFTTTMNMPFSFFTR